MSWYALIVEREEKPEYPEKKPSKHWRNQLRELSRENAKADLA